MIAATAPSWDGRRVYLVDGTTITLAPVLRREFPPATNQHGVGVWPVALLAVAHELASGAALLPAVGAKFGEHAVSETALVRDLFAQMPTDGIVMADAGFGIFAVVLNTERILTRSVDMFHKELLMSLVAYNLVTQFRRQAAALVAEPPRRMSFKRTWTTFNIFLWSPSGRPATPLLGVRNTETL